MMIVLGRHTPLWGMLFLSMIKNSGYIIVLFPLLISGQVTVPKKFYGIQSVSSQVSNINIHSNILDWRSDGESDFLLASFYQPGPYRTTSYYSVDSFRPHSDTASHVIFKREDTNLEPVIEVYGSHPKTESIFGVFRNVYFSVSIEAIVVAINDTGTVAVKTSKYNKIYSSSEGHYAALLIAFTKDGELIWEKRLNNGENIFYPIRGLENINNNFYFLFRYQTFLTEGSKFFIDSDTIDLPAAMAGSGIISYNLDGNIHRVGSLNHNYQAYVSTNKIDDYNSYSGDRVYNSFEYQKIVKHDNHLLVLYALQKTGGEVDATIQFNNILISSMDSIGSGYNFILVELDSMILLSNKYVLKTSPSSEFLFLSSMIDINSDGKMSIIYARNLNSDSSYTLYDDSQTPLDTIDPGQSYNVFTFANDLEYSDHFRVLDNKLFNNIIFENLSFNSAIIDGDFITLHTGLGNFIGPIVDDVYNIYNNKILFDSLIFKPNISNMSGLLMRYTARGELIFYDTLSYYPSGIYPSSIQVDQFSDGLWVYGFGLGPIGALNDKVLFLNANSVSHSPRVAMAVQYTFEPPANPPIETVKRPCVGATTRFTRAIADPCFTTRWESETAALDSSYALTAPNEAPLAVTAYTASAADPSILLARRDTVVNPVSPADVELVVSPPNRTRAAGATQTRAALQPENAVSSVSWSLDNQSIGTTNPTQTELGGVGQYTLQALVTDTNGCKIPPIEAQLEVVPTLRQLPNAFSPNNDGLNDKWPVAIPGAQEITVQIFDRWGAQLARLKGPEPAWTGQNAPEGVYTYVINYTDGTSTPRRITGTVSLTR